MDRVLEKLLDPSVVWIVIPVLAIVFWGLHSLAKTMRSGTSRDYESMQAELQNLQERVEKLERQRHAEIHR